MENVSIDILNLMTSFLQNDLSDEDAKMLDHWLNDGPENKKIFEEFIRYYHGANLVKSPLSAEESWKNLLNQSERKSNSLSVYWKPISIAASILIMMGIFWLFNTKSSNELVMNINFEVKDSLILNDGSKIFAHNGVNVDYPSSFVNQQTRTIAQKSGSAFYEIKKNANSPFIIENSIASIRVIGTSFLVNTNSDSIEVIVETGKVKVYNDHDSIYLTPGERVVIQSNQEFKKLANLDLNYLYWKTKILQYENVAFKDVAIDLMNKFNCQILLPKNKEDMKISGRYYATDIKRVIDILAATLDCTYSIEGNKITIISKEK